MANDNSNIPLITTIKEKCTLCYACVRVCPVKAIEVKVNQEYAKIIQDRCIGCGHCMLVCSPNAIVYRDSKEQVKALIKDNAKVAAIVGPSISGEFVDITDYRKFVQMIKALGFDYVNEVSFGVDIVANKYADLFNNFKGKYFITSNCPPVVKYVEKFYPDLIDNLAPIVSPMTATSKVIHKKYGEDVKVVFIGPCVACKDEIKRHDGDGKVDAVLTFIELRELFHEFNITESSVEYSEFDTPIGNKGSLFPLSNGILEAADINDNLLSGSIITAEGRNNIIDGIKQFESATENMKHHMNLYYCEGCIMGPGTSPGGKKFIRRALVKMYAQKRLNNLDKEQWQKEMETYKDMNFTRSFNVDDQRRDFPSDEKIKEILKIIGREESEDNDIGCGACGYDSCKDFAIAVCQGLAKTDMCLTFSLKNKHEYIKTLKLTNEKLAKTQEALKESERNARREQILAKEASETTSAMLQKLIAGVVIVDDKMKIIESNKSFINILGDDAQMINEIIPGLVGADLKTLLPFNIYNLFSYVLSNNENITERDVYFGDRLFNVSIFTIRANKIVGAIVRDLSTPEVRKEEVIKRVNEVIETNLDLVQKIAFLLGESASKTEKMLNSIIESYKTTKK